MHLWVELHLPVSDHVIRSSDGKFARPQELESATTTLHNTRHHPLRNATHLTVLLLSLTEPLNGPGKSVLHILTHFGPGETRPLVITIIYPGDGPETDLHQDSLSMGGWMGFSSSSLWLLLISVILSEGGYNAVMWVRSVKGDFCRSLHN